MKHTLKEVAYDTGAKGLLIDVPDATVMNLKANFRAGYYLVDEAKWEVPHLMEHLVLGANKEYPRARAFQAEFRKNGAYSNASTGTYDITYILECADFEWDRILDMLRLSLEQPLFLADEFEAERGNVRDELSGDLDNHFRQLVISARERFGFMVMNDQQRLRQLDDTSLEDIVAHYERTHTTSNLRFILAGNLKGREDDVERLLGKLKLKPGKRFDLPDEKPRTVKGPLHIQKPGIENLYFLIDTFASQPLATEDEDALMLLNIMLTATLHSRILGEARERGLAYDMSSHYNDYKLASNWWFGSQVMPKNCPELFDIIVRELRAVLDGKIDDNDLEAARQFSLGRYQRSVQTVGGLLNGYASGYFFDERIEDYFAIPSRIVAVTREHCVETARRLFKEQIWSLSTMGQQDDTLTNELYSKLEPLWK